MPRWVQLASCNLIGSVAFLLMEESPGQEHSFCVLRDTDADVYTSKIPKQGF